ncbi:MAG: hypothetical protein ACRCV9_16310 [Burkholderiaceae bacterium]
MTDTNIIIVETKNGSASPRSVWDASSEQDYINRVNAANPRSDSVYEDFSRAVEGECERFAIRIDVYDLARFNEQDPADLDQRILDRAERLGWYEPEGDDE